MDDNLFADSSRIRVVVPAPTFDRLTLTFYLQRAIAVPTRCHRRFLAPLCYESLEMGTIQGLRSNYRLRKQHL